MRRAAWVTMAGWLGLGCNAAPPGGGESTFDPTTGVTGTSEASSGGGASSSGGTSSSVATTGLDGSSSEGFVFDVGTAVDAPGACGPDDPSCHCNAVDLLFIVDNSGSMQVHHDPIVAAFPLFVDQMFSSLPPGTDLHVGLTRATGFWNPGNGGGWGGPACEAALTDGVYYPPTDGDNGVNGQQGRLYEHEGMRYFAVNTSDDPGPLSSWFDGALYGAIDGSAPHSNTETVVAGAAYPFHPVNAAYNTGFMRENAVLVLFLLSDSPDLTPPAVPTSDFVQMVHDAKAACGDVCVVTTGAIAGQCYDQPGNVNTRLYDFMNGFGHPPASWINLEFGMVPDFGTVLGDALADAIATTCDEIEPEG